MIAERAALQCCTICLNMTPENAAAVEPEPSRMGEFSRIVGVFFEPSKTFKDIAERPTWIVPMILVILAILAILAKRAPISEHKRDRKSKSKRKRDRKSKSKNKRTAVQRIRVIYKSMPLSLQKFMAHFRRSTRE